MVNTCHLSDTTLDRPWILYEAGVAKGTLKVPVHGIALDVPLSRVSTGPFYQFQNCDDSESDLTKLVQQLARRVPGLELDVDVVDAQVKAFKNTADGILKKLATRDSKGKKEVAEESPIAKLVEEMKALPSRVAERLAESGDPSRRRRTRRFHPMMFEEVLHITDDLGDPFGILMAASLIKDEAPWLYELAIEVYKAINSGDSDRMERELSRIERLGEFMMRRPLFVELGLVSREAEMFCMEFPRMLEHMLRGFLRAKKPTRRRRTTPPTQQP